MTSHEAHRVGTSIAATLVQSCCGSSGDGGGGGGGDGGGGDGGGGGSSGSTSGWGPVTPSAESAAPEDDDSGNGHRDRHIASFPCQTEKKKEWDFDTFVLLQERRAWAPRPASRHVVLPPDVSSTLPIGFAEESRRLCCAGRAAVAEQEDTDRRAASALPAGPVSQPSR